MEEIFESDYFTVEFDKASECSVLTWKKYDAVDNFRTPLMKAADIVRRHHGDVLIVDRTINPDVSEKDRKWVSKIFVSALKQSGCKKVIVVAKDNVKLTEYPFDVISRKFDLEIVASREEAIKIVAPEAKMSVKEALAFMGLPSDANTYAIDEKFWQMSKNIRHEGGDDCDAKLDELSEVYDIASGRRGSRDRALAARNRKKQFFGKTAGEWKTHFSYAWPKYVAIIVIILVAGNLIYNMFIKPKVDSGIVSIGHFSYTGEYYEKLLMEDMGYKNAYVNTADVVVPNDEGMASGAYAEQSADSMLIAQPNLLITDSLTTPYYFSACVDMTETYEFLKANLTESKFSKLEPMYLSEREYYYMVMKNDEATGFVDPSLAENIAIYNPNPIMIGIKVEDPEYMEAMGYDCYWQNKSVRLVFTIYSESRSYEESQQVLLRLLRDTL